MTKRSGFSLMEAVIAAAIVALGIAGAALMANSIIVNQEANTQLVYAQNLHEQTARLYQLGITPAAITNYLPDRFQSVAPTALNQFQLTTVAAVPPVGIAVEGIQNTLTFSVGANSSGTAIFQSQTNTVFRESIR